MITAETVDATQESLESLETDLNKVYPRTFLLSRLNLTLDEFERDLTVARVPVYVFVSLVVIVVLYFLALISGILGRSQGEELGLLRSRGASVAQVCGVMLLAEGVLAIGAVAAGPPVAWLIVRFLILPTFGDPGGGPIEISLSGDAFVFGAVGAPLSVLVLAVSAAGRARTQVAEGLAGRSRPPSVSFFHRYYLDLLSVLAVGLLWWQFRERDGFLSRSLETRGLDLDPTLIIGPVLGPAGGGPPADAGAAVAGPRAGVAVPQGRAGLVLGNAGAAGPRPGAAGVAGGYADAGGGAGSVRRHLPGQPVPQPERPGAVPGGGGHTGDRAECQCRAGRTAGADAGRWRRRPR